MTVSENENINISVSGNDVSGADMVYDASGNTSESPVFEQFVTVSGTDYTSILTSIDNRLSFVQSMCFLLVAGLVFLHFAKRTAKAMSGGDKNGTV